MEENKKGNNNNIMLIVIIILLLVIILQYFREFRDKKSAFVNNRWKQTRNEGTSYQSPSLTLWDVVVK